MPALRSIRPVDGMTRYHGALILYCDNHLLIAVKPPNMPAQADASGDMDMHTLMKAYVKERYAKPGDAYLGLLHRLDRPVGGLMAFARTSKAAARLSEQLRAHTMHRAYWAVVLGAAPEAARLETMLPRPGGAPQRAVLSYRRQGRTDELSLLAVTLETGRKHQIRIQLAQEGLPIWGDARHGKGVPGQQIALWAVSLRLTHPTTREEMQFDSPPPASMPWLLFKNVLGDGTQDQTDCRYS